MAGYELYEFVMTTLQEVRNSNSFDLRRVPRNLIEQFAIRDSFDNVIGPNPDDLPEGLVCVQADIAPGGTAIDENGFEHVIGHFRVGDWPVWVNNQGQVTLLDEDSLNEAFAEINEEFEYMVARPVVIVIE
jgi:hypothetical protein